jgi:cyclophilin family peptidyl-prolyl cis-trans isomerase
MGMDMRYAGRGGSEFADLPAEFSDIPYERGIVGMARAQSPNSANSQFFIMFGAAPPLDGQYTVVGTGRRRAWRSSTRSSAARAGTVPSWDSPTA